MQSIERAGGKPAEGTREAVPATAGASCGSDRAAVAELLALHFRVLSEPMRIRIVQLLADGERTVSEIARELGATQPNVSRHVHILRDAGIVVLRHDKAAVYCAIRDSAAVAMCDRVCRSVGRQLSGRAGLAQKLKT